MLKPRSALSFPCSLFGQAPHPSIHFSCKPQAPLRHPSHSHTCAMSRLALAQHYARLGLKPGGATHAEVTAAYRAMALRHHPDVGGSTEEFAAVQAARDALLRVPERSFQELGSLRMYRYRGSRENAADKWGLLGAVVLPTALGMVVGLRLLYVDTGNLTEGRGVRAGGNSRVRLSDLRRIGDEAAASRAEAAAAAMSREVEPDVVPSAQNGSRGVSAASQRMTVPETERPPRDDVPVCPGPF